MFSSPSVRRKYLKVSFYFFEFFATNARILINFNILFSNNLSNAITQIFENLVFEKASFFSMILKTKHFQLHLQPISKTA